MNYLNNRDLEFDFSKSNYQVTLDFELSKECTFTKKFFYSVSGRVVRIRTALIFR